MSKTEDLKWDAHIREHELVQRTNEKEYQMTQDALLKADESVNKRLDTMNEFREQLNKQAASFVTRDTFEQYIKEHESKIQVAQDAADSKSDATLKALVNRHDADYNSIKVELQTEREIRKSLEGSISTWKWIVGFLGASGIGGIILLFITKFNG